MNTKVFKGANVFMSRNLVPPELFDSLHDALKLNGAQIFLCCDPSRNDLNDYHIISSPDHEKFEDLKAKGCNLLGPHCVLTCAKERRSLPNQGFTCCLAMDGVKVLASGFEADEKVEIGKLVTAMGGMLHTKASVDVSFVIAKNVLAAKYKWALNVLKKPIVNKNWLHQCWKEHRIVPEESYKVLPFSGLTICVSRIPADERKVMEKLIMQNGGKYSAELTKKCTHLVCDELANLAIVAPRHDFFLPQSRRSTFVFPSFFMTSGGDKYKVAKRWGHILIVTRKWYDQSLARRACLNEETYHVQYSSTSSVNTLRTKVQHSQEKAVGSSRCELSSSAMASSTQFYARTADQDLEVSVSQNISSTISDAPVFSKDEESGLHAVQPKTDPTFSGCIADDSQTEDNDLYLSECRILLVGFEGSEMRKLVNLVRRGGGSRYMSFNEKLTHIVVGSPSETEIKETRSLAAMGIIHAVKTDWLEDCDREKKEVPVQRRHIAYDLLLPNDCAYKRASVSINGTREGKSTAGQSILIDDHARGDLNSKYETTLQKSKEPDVAVNKERLMETMASRINQPTFGVFNGKGEMNVHNGSCIEGEDKKSSTVFKGRVFRFSPSFPMDRRGEIIQWVNQGGGQIVGDHTNTYAHFFIECHGVVPSQADAIVGTYVSSHWIRSCLEDGCLLDVGSHILYSPLPCQIPFRGFEGFRICVSHYDEKERLLLRNLCFVLGTKFVEKLTKRVTHLLCKFTSGPKYEAACKWGIQPVTAEWIYECIKQNKVIAAALFHPKEVTSQDREAGLCFTSQYPTQAVRMIYGDNASQLPTQSQDFKYMHTEAPVNGNTACEETIPPSSCKKARFLKLDNILSSESIQNDSILKIPPIENTMTESVKDGCIVPDVAAAIEDLLEQTSKISDQKSPERSACDKNLFASDCTILAQDQGDPQSAFGLSKHWSNRFDKKDDNSNPSLDVTAGVYDGFSETQTDSQVVGYAEDLSGRQMIIDRVRTRSSLI